MNSEPASRTTGIDLKVERAGAYPPIQATKVAEAMGISSSRLSRIENDPKPLTDRMVHRYRLALETCRTSGTAAA